MIEIGIVRRHDKDKHIGALKHLEQYYMVCVDTVCQICMYI